MMRPRIPLLPSLACQGSLEIRGKHNNGWLVHYNVKTPGGSYVYDVRVLSAKEIKEWTGVDLEKSDG